MQLTDTHCHLQFKAYKDVSAVIKAAAKAGVTRLVCVGTNLEDSQQASSLANEYENVWATAGVHPHEAKSFIDQKEYLSELAKIWEGKKVVAVGEIGLDYYKNISGPADQQSVLREQIESGIGTGLPFIFHVRDSWSDFWKIFDDYPGLKGVIHSFSSGRKELDQILKRNLYVSLNGIMTFTKDDEQLEAAKAIPLEKLLLETDAPFLAPVPYRGEVCEPKHLLLTAEFLSRLRRESVKTLAYHTHHNSQKIFGLTGGVGPESKGENESP